MWRVQDGGLPPTQASSGVLPAGTGASVEEEPALCLRPRKDATPWAPGPEPEPPAEVPAPGLLTHPNCERIKVCSSKPL